MVRILRRLLKIPTVSPIDLDRYFLVRVREISRGSAQVYLEAYVVIDVEPCMHREPVGYWS